MRHLSLVFMIGLSVLIANPAASARDLSAGTDLSAAKKENKKKKSRQYVHVRAAAPQLGYAGQRGWFDPSLGPDGKPYRNPYPPGTCSVDMGYGRFTTCDFHE